MSMTLSDTLPQDAGAIRFAGPVDPDTEQFVLLRAHNVETIGSLDYGDLAIAQAPASGASTQTHDAETIDTDETIGTEVASAGYKRAGIHVDVGAGADVQVRVYGRLTTGGDDYLLDLVVDGQQADTKAVYIVEVASPFLAVGLQATADSATCSCTVYLLP
jgi:hypothetical protein